MTPTSGPRRRATPRRLAALLAAPLVLAACTPADIVAPPRAGAAELAEFGSCEELLGYFQEHALEQVGPWGFGGGGWFTDEPMSMEDSAEAGSDSAMAASGGDGGGAGTDFSGTNNQEEGVEEPDLVQTDGEILVTVREGSLVVVDVASRSRLGSLRLPGQSSDSELLLDRERGQALVLSRDWSQGPTPATTEDGLSTYPAFGTSRTVLTLVDLSDPANPTTTGRMRLEGDYRSARMHDGTARVVLVTPPQGLAFASPRSGSMTAEQEAEDATRAIIEGSTIDDWLPHRQTMGGDTSGTELAVPCDEISRPPEFSGLSTMSVLTFDLGGAGLEPTSSTGVVASGSTVYASTDRLVVATSPWEAWTFAGGDVVWDDDRDLTTALHTFDLTDEDSTDYLASGSVAGRMLNQFSLDEADGTIRVATTLDSSGSSPSSSSLVVLAEEGDRLVEQGRVDGLGETEQIYSVRYLDADTAAVVTFRQTDPLYLVDTSDPASPEVTGELKIPGYSAYLHPVGDDLLLGVGQDATDEGMTTGLQVSLFDISDPAAPTQVAKQTWKDHYSEVEHEHRAFTYWPQTGQLFLPANAWDEETSKEWVGVVSASVEGQSLSQGPAAQLGGSGGQTWDYARRTVVIGDSLWILGEQSVRVTDLATLEEQSVIDL